MPITSYIYGSDIDNNIWEVEFSDTSYQNAIKVVDGTRINASVNCIAWCEHHDRLYMANQGLPMFKEWRRSTDTISDMGGIGHGMTSEPNNAAYWAESFWWFTHNSNILNELQLNYSAPSNPGLANVTSSNHNSWAVRGMDLPVLIGPNTNSFGDIAIDNDGILYGYTSRGRFYKVNLSDPETTFEEISPSQGNDNKKGLQLSFSSDYSILFGHDYDTGKWYTINLTNGNLTEIIGAVTAVGSDGNGFRDLGGVSSAT